MLRPPPTSTLFPYTTLFRSILMSNKRLSTIHFQPVLARDPNELQALDRKSTRLNSSHVSISYAVFCLKKKNNTIYRLDRIGIQKLAQHDHALFVLQLKIVSV